jgi:hypothetical protein
MTHWFGNPWPSAQLRAPVCEDDALRIPTPVGSQCMHCGELIDEDDRGLMYPGFVDADSDGEPRYRAEMLYCHIECNIRSVMGCSANLRGEPHDHEVPYREDARRVQQWLTENGR